MSEPVVPCHEEGTNQSPDDPLITPTSITTKSHTSYTTAIMSVTPQVRFNDQHNTIHEIISRRDYTAEEAAATWMTVSDLCQIKRNIREIVVLMSQGSVQANSQSENHCSRGLEHFTPLANEKKKSDKYVARRTVFQEQHRQYVWRQFIYNPERLAELYGEVAYNSMIAARVVGVMDAECVAATSRASANFSLNSMKVGMASPEMIVMREFGVRQKRSRMSFISQAA
jgi:hypothetical protein